MKPIVPTSGIPVSGRSAFFGTRRERAGLRRQRLDPERPTDERGTFASTKSVPILPKVGGFTDLVPKPTQIWFRFPRPGDRHLAFDIKRTIYIMLSNVTNRSSTPCAMLSKEAKPTPHCQGNSLHFPQTLKFDAILHRLPLPDTSPTLNRG
jgi:hypothetical protein